MTVIELYPSPHQVETLEYKFYDSGPGSVGSRLDEGLLLLRHFTAQLAETVDKGQALNKQEKLYVLPVTQVSAKRLFLHPDIIQSHPSPPVQF